jgi:hypothetical protein
VRRNEKPEAKRKRITYLSISLGYWVHWVIGLLGLLGYWVY